MTGEIETLFAINSTKNDNLDKKKLLFVLLNDKDKQLVVVGKLLFVI